MAPTRTKTRKPSSQKAAEAEFSWGAPSAATTEYAVGDDVTHPQFGDGTVTEIESDKLTIEFADGRMKQIVDYCRCQGAHHS
jgi:hypothetical protein